MGSKVGTRAFQRMVSDFLRSLHPHTHTHIYMDDLLTGTRPKLCGKGKIFDSRSTSKTTFKRCLNCLRS